MQSSKECGGGVGVEVGGSVLLHLSPKHSHSKNTHCNQVPTQAPCLGLASEAEEAEALSHRVHQVSLQWRDTDQVT